MPLINLKTNLTSLQYRGDRPGGGTSGQPYMQFPIDNNQAPIGVRQYYQANRTALDFPVRGGAITQLLTGPIGIITSTVDRRRIQKFFIDPPRGTAFIEKQIGLQLTNPRTQVANSLTFSDQRAGSAYLPVTNTYNPLNTLAQVQVQGTGAHYNRHGIDPTLRQNVRQTYAYIVGAPENNTEFTNRLSILHTLKLIGTTDFVADPATVGGTGIDPTLLDRLGISTTQGQLFNYQGGPGSVYGIGNTIIGRYTSTDVTTLSNTNPDPKFTVQGEMAVAYSNIALTYKQLANQGTASYAPTLQPVQDFRDQLPGVNKSNYQVFNIANPFDGVGGLGIGNPGKPRYRVNYLSVTPEGQDDVNMVNFLTNPNVDDRYYDPAATNPWAVAGSPSKDLIKFAFECVDNTNVVDTTAIIFRAFLEGQITDTNTADYSSFKYLGRGETFRTYQGFDRTIGFAFKMFAQSRQEMLPMYMKLNHLISQVYPDYSPEYNLMRGNVIKLTIGDYIYRVPGFLENVNVTIDNDNTPWEIVLNQYKWEGLSYQPSQRIATEVLGGDSGAAQFDSIFRDEDDVRQLPHMVSVQCSFKPIMDLLPRKVDRANPFVPLIVNGDHYIDPTARNGQQRKKSTEGDYNPIAQVIVSNPTGDIIRE